MVTCSVRGVASPMSSPTTEGPAGLIDCGTECTLGRWLEEWLTLCSQRGLRPTTIEGYRRIINLYIAPSLRETLLGDIRPRQLNALYRDLLANGRRDGGGLSARTVRFTHTVLNRACVDAVRHGIIDRNPATAADPPSRRASRPRVFRTWNPAELRQFLATARSDPWYPALYLAASTGLRRGELLGLRWGDLDLEAAELQVVQAVVQVGWNAELSEPKTPSSRRRVALDRQTTEVLREHRRAAEDRSTDGKLNAASLVFPGSAGMPMNPGLFSGHFRRLVKQSGLPTIRFHDLRHGHASHCLAAGVHPKIVSERLGHSSIVVTLDTYSHLLPHVQGDAAELVASLVMGASLETRT